MPFYMYLFQFLFLEELYDWSMLTGWAAVLLILSVIAFFCMGNSPVGNRWWRHLLLLCAGGIGIWSLVVAYNGYQQWLNLTALLPVHGVFVGLRRVRTPYLAAIQTCQFQFALTTIILVMLLCAAVWQFQRACTSKTTLIREGGKLRVRFWIGTVFFFVALCCFAIGIFLVTKLYLPLIYAPQPVPFQFDEPTGLELIGLNTVSLGGPLIMLLLSLSSYVEMRLQVIVFAFRAIKRVK